MGRLFWKFFLSILLAQLAAAFAVGGAFWLRENARERASTAAIDRGPPAEIAIEAATATLRHGGVEALRALLKGMRHSLYVIDEGGRDVLGREVPALLRAQAATALRQSEPVQGVSQLRYIDNGVYTFIVPRDAKHPKGPPVPGLWDALAKSLGSGAPPNGDLMANGKAAPRPGLDMVRRAAPIVGATLASLLFAWLLAWYFSRRIRALRGAFEAAAAGNLAPQFASLGRGGGDELAELGRDFDRMSAQLAALIDGQRRLLHDVSHELRAPLARLQAAVGLAYQQPDKVNASLHRVERESMRMDKLIGELLTLSRLEAVGPVPLAEQIDLNDLVSEIVADARYEMRDSSLAISLAGAVDAPVFGAPDLLWRALENIVRNAIKYGADGGTVGVELSVAHGAACIIVSDRGPGVAAADLEHIFEPFFRAAAGNRDNAGHGLGLAIARRIIQAHGGQVSARARDGGGLVVSVRLPLERQPRPDSV